jgi:hypothetical protein
VLYGVSEAAVEKWADRDSNRRKNATIAAKSEGSEGVEIAADMVDSPPKSPIVRDADGSRTDDDQPIVMAGEREDRIVVEEPGMLALAATRDGAPFDVSKIAALLTAVDALLGASMGEQARPLVHELRTLVDAAQGPRAAVIDLTRERSKRES